jgi:AraC family transcriptional regulator of adaptative response/methylated-DNA-[protein]-cysteine methyltransferase
MIMGKVAEKMFVISEETCWRVVSERDARFDGAMVYGVRSTGIFCKPSCPSRRPRRNQVLFFANFNAAERAGFRACLRCRPQTLSETHPQLEVVLRACRLIEESLEESPSLARLGAELGISAHHLQRTFKSIMGITPRRYSAAHRLRNFKERIKKGETVTNAIYDAGYGSSSRLYEKAGTELGMTPAVYARGGQGMKINYSITDSALGRLLVAQTVRGVCAVTLGDEDSILESALRDEYPRAEIHHDENGLAAIVKQVLAHINGEKRHLDLPLDLQATAFQLRVWEELRRIPYGDTRSYSEVAASLGQPKATRAVARACASNPVALITPCHRVVRGDGSLSGYRWGVDRKANLLAQEKRLAEKS